MKADGANASERTEENLAAVLGFYANEATKPNSAQWVMEQIVRVNGRPVFLLFTIIFVVVWIGANVGLELVQRPAFDPLPYHLLHGLVSLGALATATMVLIKQERLGRLAAQRDLLDLKVMLLTEQKTAKQIDLIEELRRDLPDVRNRIDPAPQCSRNPSALTSSLKRSDSPWARSRV